MNLVFNHQILHTRTMGLFWSLVNMGQFLSARLFKKKLSLVLLSLLLELLF
jgi:hypothetical protein